MRNLRCLNLIFMLVFLATGLASNATLIDVAVTQASITTKTGFAATGVSTNDFWNTDEINGNDGNFGLLTNLAFVDGTLSGAGMTLLVHPVMFNTNGSADPMYGTYLYSSATISLVVTNLIAGVYDIYLYGHGNTPSQNSVIQLSAGSQGYGTESTISGGGWLAPAWQEGVQYVELTNVVVPGGQAVTISVEPGFSSNAVISGLQIASVNVPSNAPPLTITPSNQFVNANQPLTITNYAYSPNGPISFALGSNAPTGAGITTNGIFSWAPTCGQGSTTNLITVWATDSSTPPLSNSTTFSVSVGGCVEVSIGSSVVQAGQSTCLPINLLSTVPLTNLDFTLAYASGFLTNLSITPSNSALTLAFAGTVDPFHTDLSFSIFQSGHTLQGSSILGSLCLNTLPRASAFVRLAAANAFGLASNHIFVTNFVFQMARVVVIGNQPLLDSSLDANSNLTLTLYGNPGVRYDLLASTNLIGSSWSTADSVTLTDLFQVISLGSATNQMQFFKAVER
ncbi:MAG TPA: hypothetical protein VFC44_23805 [Candidatus Saccharimonadales bacterium]|nr:hypothetical protein [Candidatus Saccharimonadales bacterium]